MQIIPLINKKNAISFFSIVAIFKKYVLLHWTFKSIDHSEPLFP